jgi:hypothetical protein
MKQRAALYQWGQLKAALLQWAPLAAGIFNQADQ